MTLSISMGVKLKSEFNHMEHGVTVYTSKIYQGG